MITTHTAVRKINPSRDLDIQVTCWKMSSSQRKAKMCLTSLPSYQLSRCPHQQFCKPSHPLFINSRCKLLEWYKPSLFYHSKFKPHQYYHSWMPQLDNSNSWLPHQLLHRIIIQETLCKCPGKSPPLPWCRPSLMGKLHLLPWRHQLELGKPTSYYRKSKCK